MKHYSYTNYKDILELKDVTDSVLTLHDHLGGFDQTLHNPLLARINDLAGDRNIKVVWRCAVDQRIKDLYPRLDFEFDHNSRQNILDCLQGFTQHLAVDHCNFICSFNGEAHVSRKLLVSALHRFGWFNPDVCSKNFVFDADKLDGHIRDLVPDDLSFYRKFFIGPHSQEFFSTLYSFGHIRFDHANNIMHLQSKITSSFVHVVSETMATSFYPFVTEKFLYSVVTRGLFVAYAQPGWHDHLERYYGFRRYNKIFDYRFDAILNPVERLIELMSMIAKFSVLSIDDWRDLYEMESEIIEYNHDHYLSRNYIKHLTNAVDIDIL